MSARGTLATHSAREKRERFEELFAFHCRSFKLPAFHRNHRFALSIGREWRFDFAWTELMVAVEIEGLVVRRFGGMLITTGRHIHPEGFREDCLKYASAAILGWTVLRFEQRMVETAEAIALTKQLIHLREKAP